MNEPDNNRDVFVSDGKQFAVGYYDTVSFLGDKWKIYHCELDYVTFWMEIPEIPD